MGVKAGNLPNIMKCIAPTIPVWADKIGLERQGGNRLIVRGSNRNSFPVIPPRSGVAVQFRPENSKTPMHLEFANARSIDELLSFVGRHGPILGTLQSKTPLKDLKHERTWKENLVVREDLTALRREQHLFRAAVLLLSELSGKRDRVRLRELMSRIGEFCPTETNSDKKNKARFAFSVIGLTMAEPSLVLGPQDDLKRQRNKLERLRYDHVLAGPKRTKEGIERQKEKAEALDLHAAVVANGVLCDLFNRFPLQMLPCAEGAIELPAYDREGILPVLYFLLRKDYAGHHYLIKVCPICGDTFKPERGDSACCGRPCYKKFNDRDRYLRNKNRRTA